MTTNLIPLILKHFEEEMNVIIKPGSYPWPETLFEQYECSAQEHNKGEKK